ncbi:YdeI/OmpD-associated family protein [Nioella sp.]|uniref:YdeI/OmpD-associated family protein n=1 Tax=Nioella sp. TaxID=1912091 RepID=UPI003A85DDC6
MSTRAWIAPMLPAMTLTRPLQPMPDDIASRLDAAGLRAAYDARPPYQRNDYLGWIARAKRPETLEKRLAQMLDELRAGDVYMKMAWGGGR